MRRRIMGAYPRPDSTDVWIADVYALHALWCSVGTRRQAIGAPLSESADYQDKEPGLSDKLIGDMFEQCLYEFARATHAAVAEASLDEITNACDAYLVTPSRLRSWLVNEASEQIRGCFQLVTDNGPDSGRIGKFQIMSSNWRDFFRSVGGWPSVIKIFGARFWAQAPFYGGERWACIATETMDLLNQIKRGGPQMVMRAVDRVINLQHNTGQLFTNSKVGNMAIKHATLERIAQMTSITEFLPLVSKPVSELIERGSECYEGHSFQRYSEATKPPDNPSYAYRENFLKISASRREIGCSL